MTEHDDTSEENQLTEMPDDGEREAAYQLVQPKDEEGDSIVITPEMRRAIVGKLAEFELRMNALTVRQQTFVLALLEDPTSLTKAARKAGYSSKNEQGLRVIASQNGQNPRIQAAYAAGLLIREDRTMATSERTINELAIVAYSDITNFQINEEGRIVTMDGVPAYATRAIQSAEYLRVDFKNKDGEITQTTHKAKLKLWSKTDALRMLSLWQKLFSEGGGNVAGNKTVVKNLWIVGDQEISF